MNTLKALFVSVSLSWALVLGLAQNSQAAGRKIKVFILAGQSNMQGHGQIRSIPNLGKHKTQGHLLKLLRGKKGKWAERKDVKISWISRRGPRQHGPLTVGQGANPGAIGPELMFGTIMGEHFKEPVLLIKCAWGGKDVFCDFRSKSAGKPTGDDAKKLAQEAQKGNKREIGKYYRLMISDIKETLAKIGKIIPGAKRRGYELAGFAWFQGWNDYCQNRNFPGITQSYTGNLAAMLKDLRKDLKAPNLPIVIGEMGVDGLDAKKPMLEFREAQRAAAEDMGLKGVTFVRTAQFWDERLEELRKMSDKYKREKKKKGIKDTPQNRLPTKELNEEFLDRGVHWQCHYNGSSSNYCLIGNALAQALLSSGNAPGKTPRKRPKKVRK